MDNEKCLLRKIMQLSFAKDELTLFLDTHPDCKKAIDAYRDCVRKLDAAIAEYHNKYAPIYHEGTDPDHWSWAEGAWPWQNERTEDVG